MIPENDLVDVLMKAMELFRTEDNMLELQSPMNICGDLHGQLYDLFELFDQVVSGPNDFGNHKFLFLGDYVDRGFYSIETFAYLACLKVKYPDRYFLLRGNHECRSANKGYGFYQECVRRYGHSCLWALCNEVFNLLPIAALVDGRVFCVHGGISPKLPVISGIAIPNRDVELERIGAFADLCWSDPSPDRNGWSANPRGAGWLFGSDQLKKFCARNDLDFVARSHQLVYDGYSWSMEDKIVTVWSAPNYMYRVNNSASVMKYNPAAGNTCEFIVFRAREASMRRKPPDDELMEYFA